MYRLPQDFRFSDTFKITKNQKNKELKGPGKAETGVVARFIDEVPFPVGRSDAPRFAAPRTTANHTPRTIPIALISPSATLRGSIFVVAMPAIFGPFPDISVHPMVDPRGWQAMNRLARFFLGKLRF
uniref:Uncharacterized protein n=1 Tax=Candidatus Kentrum sp. TUN TaxID=2126343 RepID=A0A451A777_9GAMM|nr:MAG: hypothetical protein BECKTUN1418D_GA0071000_11624 [Candidatus Kentron sp. TUN]